ncbi:MAG: hypothetical protein K5882_04740 [Bacteroidales bacterium]|jgi:uncharacterized protein YcfL|nr:hypothetical protein [Bacteroidales bacterium]
MKKVFLFAVVAVMFVFVGCSKTKTCNCVTKQSFDGEQIVTNTTLTIDKGKCEDMNATQTMNMDGETLTQTIECAEQ